MWLVIATFFAFFVKGLCGFANTLVFTSILSFTSNNIQITPVELLLGYPGNMMVVWKERKHIDWKVCVTLAALVILGGIPGIFMLKTMDAGIIKIIFGILVIFIGVELLVREYIKKKQKDSKGLLWGVGLLSGILCGMYGIGALLAAYVTRVSEDTNAFKGNICTVFLIENTVRIVTYTMVGIITLEALATAVKLLPVMVVGLLLGMFCSSKVNEKSAKKMVIIILIISGIALVIANI